MNVTYFEVLIRIVFAFKSLLVAIGNTLPIALLDNILSSFGLRIIKTLTDYI